MTVSVESDPVADAVALVDRHLAGIPVDRKLVTVDEHTDVLLDIRTTLTRET